MRKLSAPRGGGAKVGVLATEVAALMSRAAGLWRALGGDSLARLRGEAVRHEGVRRLVADDDAALLALALAEMAAACRDLARAVSRLAARCADPLLRRFDALFAALVKSGAAADPHGLRYAAAGKMDRKARKMQRLVAATAHLCHELDVLAELEQQQQHQHQPRPRGAGAAAAAAIVRAECARRVARQRQEVERLRAASLWARTFDYAVRLLARSLFTIVARIVEVFQLQPVAVLRSSSSSSSVDDAGSASSRASRLSWGTSFVSGTMQLQSVVYPSDVADDDAPRKKTMMFLRATSAKVTTATATGDARRFLMSRSKSLRQQLRWPGVAGKHLIGCVVMGPSRPPGRDGWIRADDGAHLPLSFSYVSSPGSAAAAADDSSGGGLISFHSQEAAAAGGGDARRPSTTTTTSVFASSSRDVVTNPPESSLGAAALALHYANLIMFIEKLAASPLHICPDERDALYGMLTDRVRASLRARLRPAAPAGAPPCDDPVLADQWSDTVHRILSWLAPLAHNMVRWQAERNFEQRNVVASGGGDGGATVLLLQTLHFADQRKTEAAVTELLVGLNYMWRHATEVEAKVRAESAAGRRQLRR